METWESKDCNVPTFRYEWKEVEDMEGKTCLVETLIDGSEQILGYLENTK